MTTMTMKRWIMCLGLAGSACSGKKAEDLPTLSKDFLAFAERTFGRSGEPCAYSTSVGNFTVGLRARLAVTVPEGDTKLRLATVWKREGEGWTCLDTESRFDMPRGQAPKATTPCASLTAHCGK